ncbi:MAG: glucose-1-phosphate cytidylyltransferase [Candidatus Diapherotrites archaeon]
MKTVLLCGGKGTRMGEITELIPKPLAKIGGKPILWHIMKSYSGFGFTDFVLCLGYKGEKIKDYFSKNNHEKWDIEFVDTGLETNTGGRVKKIEDYVDGRFLCNYGDGLGDVDLDALIKFHGKKGKAATLTAVNPLSQFGIMEIGDSGTITKFREKPKLEHWINGGFFVFEKKVFDYLGENSVLEREPFENLAKDGEIAAFKHTGFWECMDTFKDNMLLNELWESGKAPWKKWSD